MGADYYFFTLINRGRHPLKKLVMLFWRVLSIGFLILKQLYFMNKIYLSISRYCNLHFSTKICFI